MFRIGTLTLVTTLAATAPAFAQPFGDGHMGWGNGWGHVFGGGILMILFWAAVIALIVYGVVVVLRRSGRPGEPGRSALDILEERYARGEINREEYEARRQDLLRDRRR